MSVTPASRAAWIVATACVSSGRPAIDMYIPPSPTAPTLGPPSPSLLCSIAAKNTHSLALLHPRGRHVARFVELTSQPLAQLLGRRPERDDAADERRDADRRTPTPEPEGQHDRAPRHRLRSAVRVPVDVRGRVGRSD